MFVDPAEIGGTVEEDAMIMAGTETHDAFCVIKFDPKGVAGRHRNFIVSIKADEVQRRSSCSFDDSLKVRVGNTNDSITTAIAATCATKF